MSNSVHKDIGYDIMQHLNDVIDDSSLIDVNEYGCYQKLFLDDGCSIHYTKWRDGKMPFYIVLYNQKDKYIFELDLSMMLYDGEYFKWHLKKPTNKTTFSILQDNLGKYCSFQKDYVNLIKDQKAELNSGTNTPRNGFIFLERVTWMELTIKLSELVVLVFEANNISITCTKNTEAEDDNGETETQSRRARRGQRKLRLKLLELYDCKCAITGYAPTEVLEAAHILSHSGSGVNHSENGLLLRADIHSLFDSNLLKIDPETFKVVIDQSLESTPYWNLNGKRLRKRIDASYPSKNYLEQRWKGVATIKKT